MYTPSAYDVGNLCDIDLFDTIGNGTRVWAVYLTGDNKNVLKLYKNRNTYIYFCQELDIVMRLTHPGIIKGHKILTRDECNDLDINHGIVVEYVKCNINTNKLSFRDALGASLTAIGATKLLIENDFIHVDYNIGNQCIHGNDGFKFIDLNADEHITYRDIRKNYDHELYTPQALLYKFIYKLDIMNLSQFWKYRWKNGKKPLDIKTNYKLSPLEYSLLYDLYLRTYNPDDDIFLSLEEIPTHPIFKLYSLSSVTGSMEPRYVNYGNWPAKNYDYHNVLRSVISKTRTLDHFELKSEINILSVTNVMFLFESIDLFYRFLPFVNDENELLPAAWGCILLVLDIYNGNDSNYYLFVQKQTNISITDRIVKSLNGHIIPRNFYHKAMNRFDIAYCWQLLSLPYDHYMSIQSERFYEVIPLITKDQEIKREKLLSDIVNPIHNPLMSEYNGETIYDQEFISKMLIPSSQPQNQYIFTKLTKQEAMEFLDLYNIRYSNPTNDKVRFYLCDLVERTYIYLTSHYGENISVTSAILDLIHTHQLNISITQQYDLDFLQNMDIHMINLFASSLLLDNNTPNVKERILRILRMNYLIKL